MKKLTLLLVSTAFFVACAPKQEAQVESDTTEEQQVYASELVINADTSDPDPKKAVQALIKKFEKAHPDIKVKLNIYDHEAYKTALRNWLVTEPPDVIYWYAGNRMKQFVDLGLLEDVSDVWAANDIESQMPAASASMTINGKKWGVPYTYYNWGIYYRKDIFDKYGIKTPQTWEDFLAACATLKKNDVTPITIGTKYLWTAGGWFDYLNMRVNGYDFHIDLMDGKIPYTDERVRNTFKHWSQLVEPGYFLENHATYSWQEAQPFMYRGEAAMYLIGNFITPQFPDDVKSKMSFFQFPVITPGLELGEDAPTDTVHIPARAKNKEGAKKFLAFVARADVQTDINKILLQLPTNKNAKVVSDPFLDIAKEMLPKAKTAQFYDRDTDPDMAKEGMKGFQEFMVKPNRLDEILERLEKTRQRIFN